MLPDGQVIFAASSAGTTGQTKPTKLFDFNPTTNKIAADATPPRFADVLKAARRQLWTYTPSGSLAVLETGHSEHQQDASGDISLPPALTHGKDNGPSSAPSGSVSGHLPTY